jgi:hypothetical protein
LIFCVFDDASSDTVQLAVSDTVRGSRKEEEDEDEDDYLFFSSLWRTRAAFRSADERNEKVKI